MQQAVSTEHQQPHQSGDGRAARVRSEEQRHIHEHEERNRERIGEPVGGHQEAVGDEVRRTAIPFVRDHRENVDEDDHRAGGAGEQHERTGHLRERVDDRRQENQRSGYEDRPGRHTAA